ncbi:SO_0444 family Cu/Zn efflux transporter [Halomonas sp. HP20-15]|uniref:SO_0444 family Cu/Zn efflux transporter n=1 Tax=Halomonas sp. HP20-15 TaxID=3085901 RepID=UPI002981DAC2|nr:SO_0444 family Cu/Zn efflux transporter [Halomonas sp. HP20-15]MDW5378149.1 SO_0444 family Cu/Zn efflux transporter [Halomonas sp. HP20-15]
MTYLDYFSQWLSAFWHLWLDAAPWLLLGLVVAGLMQALLDANRLARHLGGEGAWPSVKAALLGAPLPLCSCGVIPAALGLRRSGASRGSTASFLIATPETGVDSIALSYALLGPLLAIVRPVAAIVSAITAGVLTSVSEPRSASSLSASAVATDAAPGTSGSACCSSSGCSTASETGTGPRKPTRAPLAQRLLAGQRTAFGDLFGDLAGWLLVGLALAAAVTAFVPESFLTRFGDGLAAMLVMAAIGVPMYICASASTPLAAGLLLAGVSPGAVLVFLLAGPATNIATLGIVRRELGTRTLGIYLASVVGVAIAFGYLTNALAGVWGIDVQTELAASGELLPSWLTLGAAGILAALTLAWLGRNWLPARRRTAGSGCDDGCCR